MKTLNGHITMNSSKCTFKRDCILWCKFGSNYEYFKQYPKWFNEIIRKHIYQEESWRYIYCGDGMDVPLSFDYDIFIFNPKTMEIKLIGLLGFNTVYDTYGTYCCLKRDSFDYCIMNDKSDPYPEWVFDNYEDTIKDREQMFEDFGLIKHIAIKSNNDKCRFISQRDFEIYFYYK